MIGTLSLLVAALCRARHSPQSSKVTARSPLVQIRRNCSYLRARLARARPLSHWSRQSVVGRLYKWLRRAQPSVSRVPHFTRVPSLGSCHPDIPVFLATQFTRYRLNHVFWCIPSARNRYSCDTLSDEWILSESFGPGVVEA